MKCPECDLEQPDHTAICANCGLSFEAWHAHNPEPAKPAPDSGMTFPVQEEEEPAPREKDEPGPPEKDEPASPEGPTTGAEDLKESTKNPPTAVEKSFKWTPLHFGGLGLLTVIILTVLICAHRGTPPPPAAGQPSSQVTPMPSMGTPITPALGSPTAAAALIVTPVNSPPPATPTAVLPAAPVHRQPKHAEPADTPTENPAPEKSATPAKDEPVTMELPSDDSGAGTADTPTEAPSPVPTNEAKDFLESSEPVTASTPAETP